MLVAPLVPPQETPSRQRRAASRIATPPDRIVRRSASGAPAREAAVLVWLVCGMIVLICVPAARGGALLGATLPFWLVGAPLLDLLWLRRRRWLPPMDTRRLLPLRRAVPAATRVRPPRARASRRRRAASVQIGR